MIISLTTVNDDAYQFKKYFLYLKEMLSEDGVTPEQLPTVLKEQHGIEMIQGTMLVKVPDNWKSFIKLKGRCEH